MKVSFVTTVFNEEKTIEGLLRSLIEQTKKPEEIIVVDAGSTDKTVNKIRECTSEVEGTRRAKRDRGDTSEVKLYVKPGLNRSQGRNFGIKKAKNEIIALSDAGCILDKNWLEEITKPFKNKKVNVVAGYYQPVAENIFQKCLSCYTSALPDQIREENFLPSSRSIAFKKEAWEKVDGYPEELDYCEDLIFSKRLKEAGCKFKFMPNALVYWPQRKNISQAFKQFSSYALGDVQALYWPHLRKIILVYLRYLLGILLFYELFPCFLVFLFLYFSWAIAKSYHYVKHPLAFLYLPVLQITADLGVMLGALRGLLKKI